MRDLYHEDLQTVRDQLVEMTRLVSSAISRASRALFDADLSLAESVIEADEHIDALHRNLDGRIIDLLARQQPVATDLRTVVTSLRMSADLERMGDLARHVAKVARLRYPESAVPPELRPQLLEMAQVAERIVDKCGSIISSYDVQDALALERDDDEMDRLHRALFGKLLEHSWPRGVEPAIDLTLIGRYYERFADHAVSVARRVVFLVTGQTADEIAPSTATPATGT